MTGWQYIGFAGFNCTFMELKLIIEVYLFGVVLALIVPLWN